MLSKSRYVSIEGQGNFLTLAHGHLLMKIKLAFLSNHWAIFSQILNEACRYKEMEFIKIMLVT